MRGINIEKKILEMRQRELQEEIQASKKEKKRVNINPDSLIGREIKYQTAILYEILQETKEQTKLLRSDMREKNNLVFVRRRERGLQKETLL